MGDATLLQYFRAHMSRSPVQCRKQRRLHEARYRMRMAGVDAMDVAVGVGYESASRLNRE
jgi:AraC-like DNA-binding protein